MSANEFPSYIFNLHNWFLSHEDVRWENAALLSHLLCVSLLQVGIDYRIHVGNQHYIWLVWAGLWQRHLASGQLTLGVPGDKRNRVHEGLDGRFDGGLLAMHFTNPTLHSLDLDVLEMGHLHCLWNFGRVFAIHSLLLKHGPNDVNEILQ